MKLIKILTFCLIATLFSCKEKEKPVLAQNIDFNKGWQFSKDEIKEAINPGFDDTKWETINVPHDWSIEGPFSKENESFSRGGWLPTGKCTYFVIRDINIINERCITRVCNCVCISKCLP